MSKLPRITATATTHLLLLQPSCNTIVKASQKVRWNIFTFYFSVLCASSLVNLKYLPVIWKNLLLRPTSPGDRRPSSRTNDAALVTSYRPEAPPGVGGGWAVTRRIVWCWLCKLESPDYHHTLSHARGQGEKILYIDTSKYDFDEKLPRLPGFAIVVGWQVTKIEKG